MRTFEEISTDMKSATNRHDTEAMLRYADELGHLGTPEAEASASNTSGWAYHLRGDHAAALRCYHRSLVLYEQLQDHDNAAGLICNVGIVHADTGNYPTALEHYHRALASCEERGHVGFQANITANIGVVYAKTGDYASADEHFQRALDIHEGLGNRYGVAHLLTSLGNVCDATGDHTKAIEYHQRALARYEELGSNAGVALVTTNLVSTYLAQGSDAEARNLLAAQDAMQIDVPDVRIRRERNRAELQIRSGKLDDAVITLQDALRESNEHDLRHNAADLHHALRDLAQKRNDFAGYIEHNDAFTRITEEINGKETATKLALQEAERAMAKERSEHERYLAVLHSTLPKHIAARVSRGEQVTDHYKDASVLFLDVVGFTTGSAMLEPTTVVELLQRIFTSFDAICAERNVMKIKTIGDSYMAVAFASDRGCLDIAKVAFDMQQMQFHWPHNDQRVAFRIGLHCGPLVAGVIGTERLQYDVWGDTVNVASRMESSGEAGRIHVSEALATALRSNDAMTSDSMTLLERGTIDIKGKGPMTTYWLEGTS